MNFLAIVKSLMNKNTCLLCESPSIAVFEFSKGCLCNPTVIQPLCLHHAMKSQPVLGGYKELIEDLTTDKSFSEFYHSYIDFPAKTTED